MNPPDLSAWPRRRWLAAAAAALALAACDRSPATAGFKGVDITGAEYASGLNLQDVDGQPRTLAQYKGKVLVVFFGYTQCPDVCPTTMGELAAAKQQLGEQGKDVLPIFVTLDPERDTGPVLKAYMANFGPDFIALRGTPEQTLAAAKSFKVFFAKVPGKTETSYTLDHTAGSYLFDRQGRVRVFTRYGGGPDVLMQDLKQLLAAS